MINRKQLGKKQPKAYKTQCLSILVLTKSSMFMMKYPPHSQFDVFQPFFYINGTETACSPITLKDVKIPSNFLRLKEKKTHLELKEMDVWICLRHLAYMNYKILKYLVRIWFVKKKTHFRLEGIENIQSI